MKQSTIILAFLLVLLLCCGAAGTLVAWASLGILSWWWTLVPVGIALFILWSVGILDPRR